MELGALGDMTLVNFGQLESFRIHGADLGPPEGFLPVDLHLPEERLGRQTRNWVRSDRAQLEAPVQRSIFKHAPPTP